eukprot:CAMPEP_0202808154 /NCGR_PEP_ID=MMETSP1389-20130828/759_1 /ASSEMBLY_ACC=CAM_ASM_000865 /TAXON_ID=302021 /ORGANISM="Rhodomonas sp., Strain CCMP768" /LENGTH=147 /DNA_ID=CAMNT_0049478375 /DNA_START=28 /DNA_END=471 /DNA_ORIENTATION=+
MSKHESGMSKQEMYSALQHSIMLLSGDSASVKAKLSQLRADCAPAIASDNYIAVSECRTRKRRYETEGDGVKLLKCIHAAVKKSWLPKGTCACEEKSSRPPHDGMAKASSEPDLRSWLSDLAVSDDDVAPPAQLEVEVCPRRSRSFR